MLVVYNKGGDVLGTVNAENTVESFIVKHLSERPGRAAMAIGVQDSKGQCHIVRTQADLESMGGDGQELRGELLVATRCRRGYELWKCM